MTGSEAEVFVVQSKMQHEPAWRTLDGGVSGTMEIPPNPLLMTEDAAWECALDLVKAPMSRALFRVMLWDDVVAEPQRWR